MRKISLILLLLCASTALAKVHVKLDSPVINLKNKEAIARGAELYMAHCASCHSMRYMRFEQLARKLDWDKKQFKAKLGFLPADGFKVAMTEKDAKMWFGMQAPDLTLVARVRGPAWIYTYLRSFYRDKHRALGTNNLLFPQVGMPNVLEPLQGTQVPVYQHEVIPVRGKPAPVEAIKELKLVRKGSLSRREFNYAVNDLVTFLVYVAEPKLEKREMLGWWVLGFLIIFLGLTYWLKREFWRDVH